MYTQDEPIEGFDHDWKSLADGVAIPQGYWLTDKSRSQALPGMRLRRLYLPKASSRATFEAMQIVFDEFLAEVELHCQTSNDMIPGLI